MTTAGRIADRFATLTRRAADQFVFAGGKSQTTADTSNTTSTTVFSDAMAWAWDELPDGVYVVAIQGSLLMSHSAAGAVSIRVHCNGVDGSAHNRSVTADLVNRLVRVETFTEVVADAGTGITVKVQFKANSAGTATATNPAASATAIRVG